MMKSLTFLTIVIVGISSVIGSPTIVNSQSLDSAVQELFLTIRDLKGLQLYMNEMGKEASTQFILHKATSIVNQLSPEEFNAIQRVFDNLGPVNPTQLAKSSNVNNIIPHSNDLNELIDFNQLLVTVLELLKNNEAVQTTFDSLSSSVYSNMYKRLIEVPETKELLIGQFGISIDDLTETLEPLFNWNLSSNQKITLYTSPLERVARMLYPMMGCDNCPGCTACLPCCNLRKYLIKTPRI